MNRVKGYLLFAILSTATYQVSLTQHDIAVDAKYCIGSKFMDGLGNQGCFPEFCSELVTAVQPVPYAESEGGQEVTYYDADDHVLAKVRPTFGDCDGYSRGTVSIWRICANWVALVKKNQSQNNHRRRNPDRFHIRVRGRSDSCQIQLLAGLPSGASQPIRQIRIRHPRRLFIFIRPHRYRASNIISF